MKICRDIVLIILFCSSLNVFSQDIEITLGSPSNMLNYAGVPIFEWFPDGHISILKEIDSEQYAMYWAGHKSYRTLGNYPYPEYQLTLSPTDKILGEKTDVDAWDNGGSWLMSVFRVAEDTLLGFYHAEDHYYGTDNPGNIAWKSLGRVISYDNGISWQEHERIITSDKPKPDSPEWGGSGDNAVIWDETNNRWLCYYQEEHILMAMSEDRLGRPGTWYKYYDGSFSQPGIEGLATRVNNLTINGGNPSVHFNEYLNKYVIVYHGWNGNIYLSTSANGIEWESPVKIVTASSGNRVWYPTIIGETDLAAGKVARLYYADFAGNGRNFISRAIIFDETPAFKPNSWLYEKIGSFKMKGSFDSLSSGDYRIVAFEGNINENAAYGYHYQEIDGFFESSFRLYIDEDFPGPVGCAIRAGSNNSDEEIVLVYDGNKIFLKNGVELLGGLSGDSISLSIKMANEELTVSYKNDEENWIDIFNTTWNDSFNHLGFFTTASLDKPSIGYVSDLKIEPIVIVGTEKFIESELIIYPNPVKRTINITGGSKMNRVILMHYDGRIVRDTTNVDQLSIRDLSNGIYLLKIIKSIGEYEYQKIIIER